MGGREGRVGEAVRGGMQEEGEAGRGGVRKGR